MQNLIKVIHQDSNSLPLPHFCRQTYVATSHYTKNGRVLKKKKCLVFMLAKRFSVWYLVHNAPLRTEICYCTVVCYTLSAVCCCFMDRIAAMSQIWNSHIGPLTKFFLWLLKIFEKKYWNDSILLFSLCVSACVLAVLLVDICLFAMIMLANLILYLMLVSLNVSYLCLEASTTCWGFIVAASFIKMTM